MLPNAFSRWFWVFLTSIGFDQSECTIWWSLLQNLVQNLVGAEPIDKPPDARVEGLSAIISPFFWQCLPIAHFFLQNRRPVFVSTIMSRFPGCITTALSRSRFQGKMGHFLSQGIFFSIFFSQSCISCQFSIFWSLFCSSSFHLWQRVFVIDLRIVSSSGASG